MADRPSIEDINRGAGVGIELGCGPDRARPGYVTVDLQDLPNVDLVGDAREVLGQLDDNTITGVYTSHFLEHIDDVPGFLAELARVSRDGAIWEITVPHFSNPWYFSDVTHRGFFGLYSFCYLGIDGIGFTRKVPGYAQVPGVRLTGVRLVFGTLDNWPIRHFIRKGFQKLFNMSHWTQELYEDCFTGIIPCYQLEYRIEIDKSGAAKS